MNAAQDAFRDVVNDAIARLLPYPPRDFTIEVGVTRKDRPGHYKAAVSVVAITPMGRAIQPILQKTLRDEIAKSMTQHGGIDEPPGHDGTTPVDN